MTNKMATLDGVAQQKPCTNNVPPAPEVVNICKTRNKARRKKPCRISGRVTEAEFRLLQHALWADGYNTMQDWIELMVRLYLAVHLKKEGNHDRPKA